MAEGTQGDWLRPEQLPEFATAAPRATAAMYELRPLSLGEVLDRTFSLYRSRFWLFASMSAIAAAVQVVVQGISLTTAHHIMRDVLVNGPVLQPGAGAGVFPGRGFAAAQIGTWVAGLVFFLVSAVVGAATALALSQVYLHRPTSAKEALRVTGRRWYRWIGIALWQLWSSLWIFLLVSLPALVLLGLGTRSGNTALVVIGGILLFLGVCGGLPAGVVLYLRNALAIPAGVVEGLTIRPAMRRSKGLSAGTKGRIFVVLLISGVLYWIVGVLEAPAAMLIFFAPKQEHTLAQAITLVVSFLGRTAVAPVALIGLTLVYFDQRVRKEALDLQLLMEATAGARRSEAPGSLEGGAPVSRGAVAGTATGLPEGPAPLG